MIDQLIDDLLEKISVSLVESYEIRGYMEKAYELGVDRGYEREASRSADPYGH